ncbi:Arginase/deacetylase [Rhizoclosmatium globosum]|uniref:Arginase/deacetylase n=1 Tax=Rhizoclosmatium globosum TaxID=329046 RepID=A0A1Y2BKE4_9FUNG|nr:Arginase/deacetylase [Rhizoclosmatium globosum]|eukprot:ORY35232.1 Arginase/deacetylase [Rhizoclosmatium globosum]
MKVVYTPIHAKHYPPKELELGQFVPFKETPQRVEQILQSLKSYGDEFELIEPAGYGMAPIERVHTKEYISYFKDAYEKWISRGGNRDGVFPDAFAVRDFANGGNETGGMMGMPGYFCFDMTGIIAEGTFEAADLCGGYCFFNNAAIAVRHLIETKKIERVCILDIDYHHGNGTQSIFYKESNPLYVSLHGSPDYPMYWGKGSEEGEGNGRGFNINIPLPIGTRDSEYIAALKSVIDTRIMEYDPQIIVVSLGVDTFVDDVVGNFLLTSDCYTEMGRIIASLRRPTLFVMEGGYDIPAIGRNVTNVLRGFETSFQVKQQ